MKLKPLKPIKNNSALKVIYTLLSLVFMLALWSLVARFLKNSRALPPPFEVLAAFFSEFKNPHFFRAVFSTLLKSLISFTASFIIGLILAAAAAFSVRAKYFIDPMISALRSLPTLGVTFILFMFYTGFNAAIVIGMMVTVPIIYSNGYSAFTNTDKGLRQMARIYKVPKATRFFSVYLPQVLPYLFSAILAGFGLNLKVIIAAEIIGIPRLSIGSYMHGAYISGDFLKLFVFVLTAVLISFICEMIIKLVMRLTMPYKYSLRKRLKSLFKVRRMKKNG